jgi:phosphoserine phosphatase RsbU/P
MTRQCWAIGGDFYDYVDTGREFRVVLGDACGKGTGAALQAAMVQGILAIETREDGGPARIVSSLNRALCRRLIPARFVTLFYAILAPGGRLTYCNAGHCLPLLVKRHGVRRLRAGGPPLGLMGEATFEEASVDVEKGDVLAACSDGVLEAMRGQGDQGEEFGDQRMLDHVWAHREKSAREIVESLVAEVEEFAAGAHPHDDMTAVVVRYRA